MKGSLCEFESDYAHNRIESYIDTLGATEIHVDMFDVERKKEKEAMCISVLVASTNEVKDVSTKWCRGALTLAL